MVTDANLIMAHVRLKSIIPHTVTDEWVMEHVSKKKKKAPETSTNFKHDISKCNSDIEQCIQ